MGGWIR